MNDNTTAQEGMQALAPAACPGALVVWSAGKPLCVPYALTHARSRVGRDAASDICFPTDNYLSREHGSLSCLAGGFVVEALRPAYLDGVRFEGRRSVDRGVLRFGQTILLLVDDLARFEPATAIAGDYVESAATRAAFEYAARASRDQRTLLILAPTGAGKERLARVFHERGPRAKGEFVILDSTTLKGETALSRLFGAKRGAFTGAVDTEGLIAKAHGGTLFIDELGDMNLEVQAALLRALQERTIMPIGSTTPRSVDFALCAATNVDLEQAVAQGRFRADLLGRLEERVVLMEGLDARPDEIGFLIELAAKKLDPNAQIDASFVEACLLRPWPRNVRTLMGVADAAASAARDQKRAMVGSDGAAGASRRSSVRSPPEATPVVVEADDDAQRTEFVDTYRLHHGDEAEVMKALGISRATFYARKKKFGLGRR